MAITATRTSKSPGTRRSADERRTQVIAAAISEFAEQGYQAASTAAIARRAGISQPYIYALFPNKQELFIAVHDEVIGRIRRAFTQAAGAGVTADEKLAAMGAVYKDLIADRDALRAQLQTYATGDPIIQAHAARCYRELYDEVTRLSGATPAAGVALLRLRDARQRDHRARPRRHLRSALRRPGRRPSRARIANFFDHPIDRFINKEKDHGLPATYRLDPRACLSGAVHGDARQPGGHHRPAEHPPRARRRHRQPGVDRQRLHIELRRAAAHRRRPGRPVRAQADVQPRTGRVHARLRGSSAGPEHRCARRCARCAGGRRRAGHPADPHPPLRGLPGGPPRRGAGHLVGHQRARRRARAGDRRRGRRRDLLALDLLAQRAHRPGGRAAGVAAPGGVARAGRSRRPARAGAGQWRLFGVVYGLVRANALGWTSATVLASLLGGGVAARPVRRLGDARARRRCCRWASSAAARSPPPTPCRWRCTSGCSGRSSCSPSSSRSCSTTRRCRPACAPCRGRACR